MSRVDDASSEKRAEQARQADRLNKERLAKQRAAETTAFDRALAQKAATNLPKAPQKPEAPVGGKSGDQAEARAAQGEREAGELLGASQEGERSQASKAQKGFAGKLAEQKRSPGQPPPLLGQPKPRSEGRGEVIQRGAPQQAQVASEKRLEKAKEAERGEGAEGHGLPDSKTEDIDKATALGSTTGKKGHSAQAARDEGGSGGQQGESGSSEQKGTPFRLPPMALMAPPPLARPKEADGGRMRSIAKEIVDKIVSRVLVGTNTQGIPEFRIELKSSVLKGLSIKVSGGRGGKIRAVFSGADREVLAALKKSSRELEAALTSRGLTLEELVFDDAETG